MKLTRRPTRIMPGLKPHADSFVVETAAHDKYLLRVRMALAAKAGGIGTRKKSSQSGILTRFIIHAQRQFFGYPVETF